MKNISNSLEDTRNTAFKFASKLIKEDRATVVLLQGDLGSGKTTFAQELGRIVGVNENMHSPTFVIMKVYSINFNNYKKLIHIDAYRIEKEEELLHLGWNEFIKEPENLILIEWPERVPKIIPNSAKIVKLTFINENSREIEYEN